MAAPARSPADGALLVSGSPEGLHAAPPAAAAAAKAAAEPGSPVTLQPPPESQHTAAEEAAVSGGWWSPGHGGHRLAPHPGAANGDAEAASHSLSPLAGALPSSSPSALTGCDDATPQAGGRRRARRRHSSPFLARDCSDVDVFCPDRYSLWTQQRQDSDGRVSGSTPPRPASAGAVPHGRPSSGAAGQPPRWQAFAISLEDAELGVGQEAAVGSPAGAATNGGRRLRHAFSRYAWQRGCGL